MSHKLSNEAPMHDDLDSYIATFNEEERQELAHAEAALDLTDLLYQARVARGLTQKDAAARAGMQQQAVSRWERAHANVQLGTLRRYLDALGFDLDLVIRDRETREVLSTATSVEASSAAATVTRLPSFEVEVAARYANWVESAFTRTDRFNLWANVAGTGSPDEFAVFYRSGQSSTVVPQVAASDVWGPGGPIRTEQGIVISSAVQYGNVPYPTTTQVPSQEERPRAPQKVA